VVVKRRRGGIVGRSRGGGRSNNKSRDDDDDDDDREYASNDKAKRESKGAKERDRRAELGASFDALRLQVPSLKTSGATATKQAILQEALQHIRVLEEQSHTYHKVCFIIQSF
jgi:hypothetical protein